MEALIDVSHSVEDGMITYKGLPGPRITDHLSRQESRNRYAAGTEFHIGKIEMVGNTGTYIDSPFHRYAGGKDLAGLPLSSVAGLQGLVVRQTQRASRAIDADVFKTFPVRDKAVLVHTGWDRHWRTDRYAEDHPFLTRAAARMLVEEGARLVGIDSFNIDDASDGTRPAHTQLLAADIPIVEHLCNLHSLPDNDFVFFAVPVKVRNFGSFPVRAFAMTGRAPK